MLTLYFILSFANRIFPKKRDLLHINGNCDFRILIKNKMFMYLLLIIAIFMASASQLIIKWEMKKHSLEDYTSLSEKLALLVSLLVNMNIITAIFLTFISGICWMAVMTKLDLSYAYPLTMLGFVIVLISSNFLFSEPITLHKVIGLALIALGIFISSRSI